MKLQFLILHKTIHVMETRHILLNKSNAINNTKCNKCNVKEHATSIIIENCIRA